MEQTKFLTFLKLGSILALSIIVLLLEPQIISGQEILRSSNGCAVKDDTKPSVFISYETVSSAEDYSNGGKSKTILRLHNNTNCNIVVETSNLVPPSGVESPLFKKRITTLPNGNIETRFIPNPPEGAFLPIFYDIQETRRQKPKPANYWEGRDLVYYYTIPPGRSVTFAADSKYFRRRFIISVPFTYEWEHNSKLRTHGTIEHRVYYEYELPEGFYLDK